MPTSPPRKKSVPITDDIARQILFLNKEYGFVAAKITAIVGCGETSAYDVIKAGSVEAFRETRRTQQEVALEKEKSLKTVNAALIDRVKDLEVAVIRLNERIENEMDLVDRRLGVIEAASKRVNPEEPARKTGLFGR